MSQNKSRKKVSKHLEEKNMLIKNISYKILKNT